MAVKKSLKSGISRKRFPLGEVRETKLGEICPKARERFPFYFKLKHDTVSLLKWRLYVRRRCLADHEFRSAVWEMCRQDAAFTAATFFTLFEPRPSDDGAPPRPLPFFLWEDQVSVLAWLEETFGVRSVAVNKTRGIGMSWLIAAFALHKWLFVPESTIGAVTKEKDLLDGADSNSLLGKVDYLYHNLPAWAKVTPIGEPVMDRSIERVTRRNRINGASLQGFVSTSTKLRSLRFTSLIADEFAFYERNDQDEWMTSAGGTTYNPIFISTWNSARDKFHEICFEDRTSLLRIDMFWWNNPERWRGAYKIEAGRVVLVDKNYKHPPDYPFGEPNLVDEGTLRSPWVDAELLKPGIDRLKHLRDLYGSVVCQQTKSFFGTEVQRVVEETIKPPDEQGMLDLTGTLPVIRPTQRSEVRLWGDVTDTSRGPYVMGCDWAHGVGSAFSTAIVLDSGGQQVLEYGSNETGIVDFAGTVVALARWLAGDMGDGWVLIDFEANGLPKAFTAELLRLEYGNLHMSEHRTARIKAGEVPKYAGTVNRDKGLANFRELERAILAGDSVVRSERIRTDMRMVERDELDGKPIVPVGKPEGHADFLAGYGIAWWRARERVRMENRVKSKVGHVHLETTTNLFEDQPAWSDAWR